MKTTLCVLLALLICIASFFILHHTKLPALPAQKKIIDSFILNASYTEYDKKGEIKTKLSADKVTHFEPSGSSVFVKPVIITYTTDRTPWHISADEGSCDKDSTIVVLKGHVIAHELATKKNPGSTITSTELTIYPKESRVATDKPVVLTRPGIVIHGTGFRANLKTGKYQLLSQSKAVYQP